MLIHHCSVASCQIFISSQITGNNPIPVQSTSFSIDFASIYINLWKAKIHIILVQNMSTVTFPVTPIQCVPTTASSSQTIDTCTFCL